MARKRLHARKKCHQTAAMRLATGLAVAGLLGLAAAPAWGAAEPGLYWANAGAHAIGHADLDGGGVDLEAVAGINYPRGVALNEEHVYWANSLTHSIGRADLDGSNVDQTFIAGPNAPRGVAVDGRHIYWTNFTGTAIGRADLDGSNVEAAFIPTPTTMPVGIAVAGGHLYWTIPGVGVGGGQIGRADIDGSHVDEAFITGATSPEGVAVDGGHIYWTNTTNDTLGRANLDGTGADQQFVTGANSPVGIAVDGRHVYWANNDVDAGDPDTLGRANLDGTDVEQSFVTEVDNPLGVAVMPVTRVTVPAGLDFGSQTVGDAGGPATVSVENTGDGTLRVDAASITGPDAADFEIAAGGDQCSGSPVAAGESCGIAVRFKPGAAGARAATLTLTDNAQDGGQSVALAGVGAAAPDRPVPPGPSTPSGPSTPPGPAKPSRPPSHSGHPDRTAHAKVTVKILSGTARHGRLRLRLRCSGATRCRGEINLVMSARPNQRSGRRSRAAHSLPAGRRGYAIDSGRQTVAVRLNRRALHALRRRGRLRITATASVRGDGHLARATRTVRRGR